MFKRHHQNGLLSQSTRHRAGRGRAVCREHGAGTAPGQAARAEPLLGSAPPQALLPLWEKRQEELL